jgi:cobalt-zinc-cadmium efflux system membrane fusion protein
VARDVLDFSLEVEKAAPEMRWLLITIWIAGCHQAWEPPPTPPGEAWVWPKQIEDAHITVAPVGHHEVGGAIVTSGKVTFDDLRVAHVFSPVSGRLTRILAQPGERVKKDQPLAAIQSPDLGQAFSDLAKAQAELSAAGRDYRRQKMLYDAHATSQKNYEAVRASYNMARAETRRAERKVHLLSRGGADRDTQEFLLKSPIDGEIIVRNVNPGIEVQGTLSGSTAVELFTVGELDRVWVIGDVFEMDLARLKRGAQVSARVVSYPQRIFDGNVEWVSGSLDANTRTAKVRVSVDNHEGLLKPEMYATVSITVDERQALAIPRTAVMRQGEQTIVFKQIEKASDGRLRFERVPVAVDEAEGGDWLPLTHGVSEGDRIVTSGGILLLGML